MDWGHVAGLCFFLGGGVLKIPKVWRQRSQEGKCFFCFGFGICITCCCLYQLLSKYLNYFHFWIVIAADIWLQFICFCFFLCTVQHLQYNCGSTKVKMMHVKHKTQDFHHRLSLKKGCTRSSFIETTHNNTQYTAIYLQMHKCIIRYRVICSSALCQHSHCEPRSHYQGQQCSSHPKIGIFTWLIRWPSTYFHNNPLECSI